MPNIVCVDWELQILWVLWHIKVGISKNRMGNLIVLCPNHHSQADSINRTALKNHANKHYKKEKVVNIYK